MQKEISIRKQDGIGALDALVEDLKYSLSIILTES
jgi:hypothetical protein